MCLVSVEENSKDIVKKAAQAVGSLSDTEFVAAFNTDVYQLHVRHANPEVRYNKWISEISKIDK